MYNMQKEFCMEVRFKVFGNVQGVMFRKSFVSAVHKLGFAAGATNDSLSRDTVLCTIKGQADDLEDIETILQRLLKLNQINDWGAKVVELTKVDHEIEFLDHDCHTEQTHFSPPANFKVYI